MIIRIYIAQLESMDLCIYVSITFDS